MTKDTHMKSIKYNSKMKNSKFKKEDLNKKRPISSDDNHDINSSQENDSESDSDSTYYPDDDSEFEEEEMDELEYRKFLKSLFPSKYMDKKIKAGENIKKIINKTIKEDDSESDNDEEIKLKTLKNKDKNYKKKSIKKKENKEKIEKIEKKDNKNVKKEKKDKKNNKDLNESVTSISGNDSGSETESDDNKKSKPNKFNIVFTIGNTEDEEEDEYNEEDWETLSQKTENEDDPISSESEDNTESESENENASNSKKIGIYNSPDKEQEDVLKEKEKEKEKKDVLKHSNKKDQIEEENDNEIINILKDLKTRSKSGVLVSECLKLCEQKISNIKLKNEKKLKKEKDRNCRIFKKILRDKNTLNDYEFYDKLESDQQKKIIKELREINKITRIEKPYRLTLLESDMPIQFKAIAMKKISSLRYMEEGSGEYYKNKNWVDTFMRIPFNNYQNLPITMEDGVDKCHDFMESAKQTLDDAVYGLNDAKMQIMQMLGQLITNPKSIGSAIAIHGPPGTGKTSLVKEGISKILNRPFAFIALGGATDSSFLEGHGYTYEGSTWGKIVQILLDSRCMNPVIYFDELDKISDTPKGEEIAGILTHLTDTTQNSNFHDKYFAEIDFDLSKCLFIFSYNDESKVNPILKDRMYRIQTKGYSQKQKTNITNNYLLPKIREQIKFTIEDIVIDDTVIQYIIEYYCNKEDGVRNLKRCLEIIYTKLNLYRLMRPDTNLFEEDMSLKVSFPFHVTKEIIEKLIKKTEGLNTSLYYMYL
jgi:ATP-dependent Lon protease